MRNDIRIMRAELEDTNKRNLKEEEKKLYFDNINIFLKESLTQKLEEYKAEKREKFEVYADKEDILDDVVYGIEMSKVWKQGNFKQFEIPDWKDLETYCYIYLDSIFLKELDKLFKIVKMEESYNKKDTYNLIYNYMYQSFENFPRRAEDVYLTLQDKEERDKVKKAIEDYKDIVLNISEFNTLYNKALRELKTTFSKEINARKEREKARLKKLARKTANTAAYVKISKILFGNDKKR